MVERKWQAAAVVLACSTVLCSAAQAAVVFSDTFEDDTVNMDPNNTKGTSDDIVLQGDWFHYNRANVPAGDINVTNASSPGAPAGSNYLRVSRTTGADAGIAAAITHESTPFTNGTITTSYNLYVPNLFATVGNMGILVGVSNLSNDSSAAGLLGGGPTVVLRDDSGDNMGHFRYFSNNFGTATDLSVPRLIEDEWRTVTMVMNLIDGDANENTFTLDYSGDEAGPTGPLPFNTSVGAISGIGFNAQPGGTYYIDNLVVDYQPIPEPTALAALGLGALGLLGRRRATR